MSANTRVGLPVVLLAGAVMVGCCLLFGREARSYADAEKSPAKWEYHTTTVEPASLQAKLNELGAEGWEAFSVERASLIFQQDSEKQTHLVVENYQIISRRAAVGKQ